VLGSCLQAMKDGVLIPLMGRKTLAKAGSGPYILAKSAHISDECVEIFGRRRREPKKAVFFVHASRSDDIPDWFMLFEDDKETWRCVVFCLGKKNYPLRLPRRISSRN